MVQVDQKKMRNNHSYEARGVIAKLDVMGKFDESLFTEKPIYRFLTLDRGKDQPALPVQFVKPAPVKEDKGEAILDIEKLEVGDIVVHPCFVYRECKWFPALSAAHMKALQTYKPKVIMEQEKADAPAFDLGTIDHTSDQVTKQ